MTSVGRKRNPKHYAEWILCGAILAGIAALGHNLIAAGYLPEPFINDIGDTFMDWYNTAYWAHRPGAFQSWATVYPPFTFVFLKVFSVAHCYEVTAVVGRTCDRTGALVLTFGLFVNAILVYLSYKRSGVSPAIPRAIAVSFGIPMLFAWERGNLIIPCFTFYVISYGGLVRSAWVRMICSAVTINLKPYLLLVVATRVLRREWRWAEWVGISMALIYAVSYIILGEGTPFELLHNLVGYSKPADLPSVDVIRFTSTYLALMQLIESIFPVMHFVGSAPIEWTERLVPVAMNLGMLGVLVCLAGALMQPLALSRNRLASLILILYLTTNNPGGYVLGFLLFFIFQEKMRGLFLPVVIVCAYIWCIPYDYPVVTIAHQIDGSYLTNWTVGHDLNLTLGELVRPGLLLLMEYALVATSLGDIYKRRRAAAWPPPLAEEAV